MRLSMVVLCSCGVFEFWWTFLVQKYLTSGVFQLDIPPLRLVVPVKYPESGASICYDRWAFGGQSLSDMSVQFEKCLSMIPNSKSIAELVNAWKLATEHVLKVGVINDDNVFGDNF